MRLYNDLSDAQKMVAREKALNAFVESLLSQQFELEDADLQQILDDAFTEAVATDTNAEVILMNRCGDSIRQLAYAEAEEAVYVTPYEIVIILDEEDEEIVVVDKPVAVEEAPTVNFAPFTDVADDGAIPCTYEGVFDLVSSVEGKNWVIMSVETIDGEFETVDRGYAEGHESDVENEPSHWIVSGTANRIENPALLALLADHYEMDLRP